MKAITACLLALSATAFAGETRLLNCDTADINYGEVSFPTRLTIQVDAAGAFRSFHLHTGWDGTEASDVGARPRQGELSYGPIRGEYSDYTVKLPAGFLGLTRFQGTLVNAYGSERRTHALNCYLFPAQ